MADDTDVLIMLCEHEWAQAKQSEDQRATISNIVLLVASILIGLVVQSELTREYLPLSAFLIVLGIYGAITSEKLYERHQFHFERARVFRHKMIDLHPVTRLTEERQEAGIKHALKFPRLSKTHLHHLWLILHIGISTVGIILSILIWFG